MAASGVTPLAKYKLVFLGVRTFRPRASLVLVLVLATRAPEIAFPRAACPTVDPSVEARGTGETGAA